MSGKADGHTLLHGAVRRAQHVDDVAQQLAAALQLLLNTVDGLGYAVL
jgi:hypothetical protein